jgi:hypothetical protein
MVRGVIAYISFGTLTAAKSDNFCVVLRFVMLSKTKQLFSAEKQIISVAGRHRLAIAARSFRY